jgi:Ca2+-binding EF-hand superfamily protein
LNKLFDEADIKKRGQIDLHQFHGILHLLGMNDNVKFVENQFRRFDSNKDGLLTKEEFKYIMM